MNIRNRRAGWGVSRWLCAAVVALVLATWVVNLASASIILKVMAINPSKDEAQTASVKAYLPKEAKSDDVLSKGDLQVIYDTQQGSYFVYGEIELKPGEIFEQDIELRDVWSVAQGDIDGFRAETVRLGTQLKDGEFAERFAFLKKGIDARLDQIESTQKFAPSNPEGHISVYRENLKALEAVRADLDLARGFLAQSRSFPPGAILKLIGGIVVFLGVLGASFYFVWQKQLNVLTGDPVARPAADPSETATGPVRRGAAKDSKNDPAGKV